MKFKENHNDAKNLIELKSVKDFLNMISETDGDVRHIVKKANELKNNSFKHHKYRSNGSATVFVNRKDKVVIKLNGIIGCEKTPTLAIPTIIHYIDDIDLTIRIQPLADVSRKTIKEAMKTLENLSIDEVGYDCHQGNVGKYKDRFVVIDW